MQRRQRAKQQDDAIMARFLSEIRKSQKHKITRFTNNAAGLPRTFKNKTQTANMSTIETAIQHKWHGE